MRLLFSAILFAVALPLSAAPTRPRIVKKGTVDLDLCETTPLVFKGRLYRMEWCGPPIS